MALADETAALMTGIGAGAANNIGGVEAGSGSAPSPAANGVVPAPSSAAENGDGVAEKLAAKQPAPVAGSNGADAASKVAAAPNDSSMAGSKTPAPLNGGSTADTPQDTPASTPRRRIKKRRHDDFVYAGDKKAQKPGSGAKPKATVPAAADAEPAKKKRKRPRKCPAKDSILMEVPLSVTADVGVALKRTRRKRTQRIKEWVASGAAAAAAKSKKGASPKNGKKSPKDGTKESTGEAKGEGGSESLELAEDDLEPLEIRTYASAQGQGSLLDYLEAKYVRGVMLDDYDEREQSKAQTKDGGTESDDSDGKGSCYDEDDGWIDDSLMIEEVAGQVVASSAYGMTQIEEEARKRKEERKKGKEGAADATNGDGKPDNPLEGLDIGEEDKSDAERSEGEDSDFDDGFFVNFGDLEMAEGWTDEPDMGISPERKKKKRAYNKKSPTKEKGKAKSKTAKKKGTTAKAAAPGAKKKAAKKAKEEGKKATTKKKKGEDGKAAKKKSKKADGETPKKKKKASTSVLESATASSESKTPTKKQSAKKKAEGDSATTPKKKSPESKEKEAATKLKRLFKRRYNVCVKLIGEMTSKELPRKPRTKMMKVSVNIPPDKTIGDEITFSNPSVPGQKLKAKIPKKADLENRCFVVSIPAPKVAEPEAKENVFPKEFKQAVYNYATAYDDWCLAEGEYNESLPKDKQKDFKPNQAKKAKFDEMVLEFPKNLATPVDEAKLRKIAHQERNNALRREKRKQAVKQEESAVRIPQKGTEFAAAVFSKEDFQEGK